MKTQGFFKLLLILILLPLAAMQPVFASPVWQVEYQGKKLYLAGTMHLLKQEDYPLPKAFEQAFKNSKSLYFETDMGALTDPAFQQKMVQAMLLKPGESLKNKLKQPTYEALAEHFQQRGIAVEQFLGFKAGFVGINIALIEFQMMGLTATGVDAFYHEKAKQSGKGLGFLETPEQQIQFLAEMGAGQEDEFIQYTLADIKKVPTYLDNMRKAWRDGNNTYFVEDILKPMKQDFPPVYQSIIVQRNLNWMDTLSALLQSDEVELVLVGSLHLPGEKGLLTLLQQKGATLKQLK